MIKLPRKFEFEGEDYWVFSYLFDDAEGRHLFEGVNLRAVYPMPMVIIPVNDEQLKEFEIFKGETHG